MRAEHVIEDGKSPYASVAGFEDLVAWRKAKDLTVAVYELCRVTGVARDFALRDQLQRSAVSIMSNIAEGYERSSTQDYHRFLTIAKGSCAEVRSLLHVAYSVGYIDKVTFEQHLGQAEEVARILGGLRASIARRLQQ